MASLTAAEFRNRVLEHIGYKPAGQGVGAEDGNLADEIVTAAHARLRTVGLAPFAISSIPEWAQIAFRDYVAGDIGGSFGYGDKFKPSQYAAEKELVRLCAVARPKLRIKAEYF